MWTQFDGYCERTDFTFWSEPLNAATNFAFLVAAIVMWRRLRGQNLPLAMGLVGILAAIGIGSFLFHTFATRWAAMTDVIPIGVFILTYLYAVNRYVLGWPLWAAMLGTAGFMPFAYGVVSIADQIPFFKISNFYWSVPVLLVVYALFVLGIRRQTAFGLLIGAGILALSITFRSLDELLCHIHPSGTHTVWHVLNAIMLGWMIEVYRRHRLATARAGG